MWKRRSVRLRIWAQNWNLKKPWRDRAITRFVFEAIQYTQWCCGLKKWVFMITKISTVCPQKTSHLSFKTIPSSFRWTSGSYECVWDMMKIILSDTFLMVLNRKVSDGIENTLDENTSFGPSIHRNDLRFVLKERYDHCAGRMSKIFSLMKFHASCRPAEPTIDRDFQEFWENFKTRLEVRQNASYTCGTNLYDENRWHDEYNVHFLSDSEFSKFSIFQHVWATLRFFHDSESDMTIYTSCTAIKPRVYVLPS